MHRLALAIAILLLATTAAPVAYAQLGPNVPSPLTEDPPPPPAPQKFEDEGFSSFQQILIFGSAGVVLAAIAFFIMRDARKAAPPDERARGAANAGGAGGGRGSGAAKSARERERAARAKRQKAKAARRQRRRNRP